MAKLSVFEISDVRHLTQTSAAFQAFDYTRKGGFSLSFDDVDVCAEIVERCTEGVTLIVARVISNQRPTDDDLHCGVVRPDELNDFVDGEIHDIEGGGNGDTERVCGKVFDELFFLILEKIDVAGPASSVAQKIGQVDGCKIGNIAGLELCLWTVVRSCVIQ